MRTQARFWPEAVFLVMGYRQRLLVFSMRLQARPMWVDGLLQTYAIIFIKSIGGPYRYSSCGACNFIHVTLPQSIQKELRRKRV